MMRIKSFLSVSNIHGVGCFTCEPLTKGQIVWEFDRGFDREYSADEVSRLPASTRSFFETHAWASPRKTILVCADHGGYFNHKDAPNTGMTSDGFKCVALRDIAANEELTADYSELPGVEEAEGGPSSPVFKAITRGPLGGASVALCGGEESAVWSLLVGTVASPEQASHVAEGLNRLLADGLLRAEIGMSESMVAPAR